MKKPILNEEIGRLRKMMGLNENFEMPSKSEFELNGRPVDVSDMNTVSPNSPDGEWGVENLFYYDNNEELTPEECEEFKSKYKDYLNDVLGQEGDDAMARRFDSYWQGESYNPEEKMNEGTWEVDPTYTHFAISKNDGKIYNGWEYDSDTDKESILYYCKMDLNDMDLNPKDFKINSKKFLLGKGFDPLDSDNWKNTRMDEIGVDENKDPEEKMVSFDDLISQEDQAMIDAHDEEEANKYASKNYDDVESGAIAEDWGGSDQGYMNKMIHDDLNQPTEFSFGMFDDLKSAAAGAVDHFWDDWEEYKTDRDGLVMKAMKLYLRRYFPDWYENVSKMFS
jgi:hypothetical protein